MKYDMKHCSQDYLLITRKIWQQLFNLYRNGGGSLCFMDSLLCDIYSIEDLVSSSQEKRKIITFYWSFSRSFTMILAFPESKDSYKVVYDPLNCFFSIDPV